ncbi:mohawk homeobox S homeolog isoform X1 [Xenopus laevis]|uniref:Mohawk homeobox S homeolog isoform X1 n=1 Tax=Xenopus laevis TaxID=8355 RepID=A0A8J0VM94_XENLA|nr:mohawk homeobox S homeolog isoform X1 [Xenopus laevis]
MRGGRACVVIAGGHGAEETCAGGSGDGNRQQANWIIRPPSAPTPLSHAPAPGLSRTQDPFSCGGVCSSLFPLADRESQEARPTAPGAKVCTCDRLTCSERLLRAPAMNAIVFNKLSGQVLFEESANDRERGVRPYLGVMESPNPDVGLQDGVSIKDNASLRHRRPGSSRGSGKVRHKRQALQDMARPLKQWLYKHRDNPYPTKTEKILLALGSQMTLVQVSNWFANARRRLKNTVRQPDLSWALRIKLYNKYVQGNAERLSVSSEDSCSEDGEHVPRSHNNEEAYDKPMHHTVITKESSVIKSGVRAESSASEDYVSPPKYKSSLLHRYLNDSLRHVMASNAAMREKTRQRNHSGSFSSNEFEEELVSPSSSETEGNFVYRTDMLESAANKCQSAVNKEGASKDETYWREINAAMALTNLAQGKDKLQGTTSCIIQKSSHISEVKTVKVALLQKY